MSIVGHVKRFWRFHSLIIGAFGICAFTLGCAVQEPAYYEGTWVVTKAYNVGVSAHSSIESEKFLGRSVTYASDSAKLDQAFCEAPVYSTKISVIKIFMLLLKPLHHRLALATTRLPK